MPHSFIPAPDRKDPAEARLAGDDTAAMSAAAVSVATVSAATVSAVSPTAEALRPARTRSLPLAERGAPSAAEGGLSTRVQAAGIGPTDSEPTGSGPASEAAICETVPRRYFAASNSARGFCNYYGDCFSERRCDQLYIIKGGPGTGKSHFMRTVARHARAAGYAVTEYDCSSDPVSLDGILLCRDGSPRIGLLDGTAPHVCEPVTPGVREEIINLGAFWDAARLRGSGDQVRHLSAQKSAAYQRAYAYLRAAGELDAVADALTAPAVREDRLSLVAARILRRVPRGSGFDAVPALRRAVSMTGRATHHTFESMASDLILLDGRAQISPHAAASGRSDGGHYGLGARLLGHMLSLSRERGHTVLVSYDPIYPDKCDGLFYPAVGLCVLVGDGEPREGCSTRCMSLRRHLIPETLREVRGELRHAITLRRTLEDDALRSLAEAAKNHFDLENIYAEAMDFPAKESFTESFCAALFRR